MDILRITTGISKKIVSKALTKMISKKLGYDVDICVEELLITRNENENAKVAFSGTAEIPLDKIINL